jgi:molecular chaperone HscB
VTFPDPTQSYFEVLGVSVSADEAALSAAFRKLSRLYHPDRFASADEATQSEALATSALLTSAHRTLSDPFERAEYLLRLTRGWKPDDARKVQPPPALFARVLELQELVSDYAEGDSSLREELLGARTEFAARYDAYKADLIALFARYDSGDTEAALDEITQIAALRGYPRRVVTNIDAAISSSDRA